jgi:phage antirepressor YoqD-like protein
MLQIQQNKSVLTMSSQEISALVNSRHDSVKRSVERLASLGAIQLPPLVEVKNGSGQTVEVYMIGKRDSYIVVAQLSPEFTAALVDRWQELESSNHQAIPKSFAEALRLAADQQETIQAQAAQIEHQKPAVEFIERYVESTGNLGFRQVCKLLKAKENDFRAFLQDNRIMYRLGGDWVPYASHIEAGRFYVTTGTGDNDHNFTSAKFTSKGVQWVAKLWGNK